jgi:hypothetical protein
MSLDLKKPISIPVESSHADESSTDPAEEMYGESFLSSQSNAYLQGINDQHTPGIADPARTSRVAGC